MLNDVKLALRISHNALDSEIIDLIDEARQDLKLSGISFQDETDPLFKRVIKTYAKANYAKDLKDAERYQNAYNLLKNHLSLSADYTVGDSIE